MRILVLRACVALCIATAFARADDEDAALKTLHKEYDEYQKKQFNGLVFTILGGITFATGAGLMIGNRSSLAGFRDGASVGIDVNSGGAAAGIILSIAGLPNLIAGIVQLTKANKELKNMERIFAEEKKQNRFQDEIRLRRLHDPEKY